MERQGSLTHIKHELSDTGEKKRKNGNICTSGQSVSKHNVFYSVFTQK